MSKETFGIGILSLTALVLLMASYFAPAPVIANDAVQNRDYQIATARLATGGDCLYVLDNRTGIVAVFVYDPTSRRMVPRVTRPISDVFASPR
jgi:hypothetical protein